MIKGSFRIICGEVLCGRGEGREWWEVSSKVGGWTHGGQHVMMVAKRLSTLRQATFLLLGPALPNEAPQGRSHPKSGKECLLSPMCPLDGAWSPRCWERMGDRLRFGRVWNSALQSGHALGTQLSGGLGVLTPFVPHYSPRSSDFYPHFPE